MYRILIPFIIFALFNFSCATNEKEEEKISETLGSKNGDAVYMAGYDYNGNKEVSVTISPYEKGLKILFSPVSSVFICSVSII